MAERNAMTYRQWLNAAAKQLNATNPQEDGKTDALYLLSHVSGQSFAHIRAFDDTPLNPKTAAKLTALFARRLNGEPIAYITGERGFWTLDLAVSPVTLIPRADTEMLVETALAAAKVRLNTQPFLTGSEITLDILDLGTGTGAVALALAAELTPITQRLGITLRVCGVDRISQAVTLAAENARRNGIENVRFWQSDWFSAVAGQPFDLIVGNPPYIDPDDAHLTQGDVRFEPLSALTADEQGYADLRLIIEQAAKYLKPQGSLILEHGSQQGEKVRSIFRSNGWVNVETRRDYGGNERLTWGSKGEQGAIA